MGYASSYLMQKSDKLSLENNAKLNVYQTLFEIDDRLGMKSELQLWLCCYFVTNIDIIQVQYNNHTVRQQLIADVLIVEFSRAEFLFETLDLKYSEVFVHY